MSEFTGMALYTKEEIGCALESYKKEIDWANNLLKDKICEAESKFKPTIWDKLFGNESLKDKQPTFTRYKDWLYGEGYITFTEDERKRIDTLNRFYNMYCLGGWLDEDEYWQVKNLYNGGKDCYLNPNQAAFVNRFKNKEVSQCQN